MQRHRSAFGFENLIHAIGGVDGIVLTLSRDQVTREDGAVVTTVYSAVKADAGPGPVVFVDPNGALFNGRPSWDLTQQYQGATFFWDGEGWNVLAFPNPLRRPSVNSGAVSSLE